MTNRLASFALLALLSLSGCCMAPTRRTEIEDLSQLKPGQVVVVGRVVLDPPLSRKEQHITKGIGTEEFKGSAVLYFGEQPYTKEEKPGMSDMNGYVMVPFNGLFYAAFDPWDHYFQMMSYLLDLSMHMSGPQGRQSYSTMEWAYFPLNRKMTINEGDQVIYIGTVQFKRDDFNSPKGVSFVDHSEYDYGEIKKRFGKNVKIRKISIANSK